MVYSLGPGLQKYPPASAACQSAVSGHGEYGARTLAHHTFAVCYFSSHYSPALVVNLGVESCTPATDEAVYQVQHRGPSGCSF